MTEKKIFVYKLFMLLNISDFSLFFIFYVKTETPLKKVTFFFPVSPLYPAPTPGWKGVGGGCTLCYQQIGHPKFSLLTEMQLWS